MSQIKLSQIREELLKIKDFDSLKKEIKKLIAEIEKFDFKKAIPEDKLEYVEQKYAEIMKTINGLQSKVEKEVNTVMKRVNQGKGEYTKLIKQTQTAALKQKKDLEKLLKTNFDYFSKKAKASFKGEEKNLKKTIKKVRKTAIAKAKKTLNSKTKRVVKTK